MASPSASSSRVQSDDLLLGRGHGLARSHQAHAFAHQGVAPGVEHLERRLAQDLFRSGGAEQAYGGGIQEDNAIVLADQDAVGG
jgi:hypothetical protein